MSRKSFDVIIVGAGPAGIFACLEFIEKAPKLRIGLIDMGVKVEKRKPSDVMSGFGGAGTYSDGKLHYTVTLSHERALHLVSRKKYQAILDYIRKKFKSFGVNSEIYPKSEDKMWDLIEEAEKHNIELVERKIQHVGTDKLKKIIQDIQNYILSKSIEFIENVKIVDVILEKERCVGVIDSKKNKYFAKKVLLSPGRISTKWLQDLANKYKIDFDYGMVEVGVRVEFPESIFKRHADTMYESIFRIRTNTFDDIVRTFCPCPNGYVAMEDYHGYVCVNGHSDSDYKSKNSNFAFVCEVNLTKPVENTVAYAQSIAELASTIGGGKPILQRLADLRKGRRSTWSRLKKSLIEPSLTNVTPGDISMALPHRIVTNIREGLEKLDEIMPGINSGSTLLYAPEVKFRSSMVKTDKNLQTSVDNLYVAGDAAGISGSITGAAATGIIAARGIIKEFK